MTKSFGGPKEVFLHLFSIVALYVSAGALIALLFQHINLAIPFALDYFSAESARSGIRWAVAVLTVSFPVYIASVWYLRRISAEYPAVQEMRIRKWLVYLTLFAAALIVLGDFIGLLFSFLEGDLTLRFALKALSLAVVAGVVFWYYLWEMRGGVSGAIARVFKVIVALVAVAIVAGFWVAGSPASQRAERLDAERVQDIRQIQTHIVEYWRAKDTLPPALDALPDPLRGVKVPVDPATDEPYEYRATDELSFELCATFSTEQADQEVYPRFGPAERTLVADPGLSAGDGWSHPAGYYCFERTIDPDFLKAP